MVYNERVHGFSGMIINGRGFIREAERRVFRGGYRPHAASLGRKEDGFVSGLPEMKQRLQRMAELGARMREQLERLKGPEGAALRDKAKEAATRIGIGAGIAVFGLMLAAVAAVYIIAVVILLVNIALDRLWLSALIVVAGSLLLGGAIAAIGVGVARKGARDLPRMGTEALQPLKETGEEIRSVAEELQEAARREAEERRKQAQEMLGEAMKYAPYVIGAYIAYRVVKKAVKAHKARKLAKLEALAET